MIIDDKKVLILNDIHQYYATYSCSCTLCKESFNSIDFVCNAFPDGIPIEILSGDDKHTKKHNGQKNDIVFSVK